MKALILLVDMTWDTKKDEKMDLTQLVANKPVIKTKPANAELRWIDFGMIGYLTMAFKVDMAASIRSDTSS